jgi:hypothetical protein
MIRMTHPAISGSVAYATPVAFAEVWEPKGWIEAGPGQAEQAPALVLGGPQASRPLASQVPAGTLYFADEGDVSRSDGGNWHGLGLVSGGPGDPGPGLPPDLVGGVHVTTITALTDVVGGQHVTTI